MTKAFTTKQIFISFLIIYTIIFFVLNTFSPVIYDDYNYGSFTLKNFTDLQKIFNKYVQEWLLWTSRSGNFLQILIFNFEKKYIFNILNTVIGINLLYLIFFYAKGRLPKLTSSSDLIIFSLIFVAIFSEFLTNSGNKDSFNDGYLWATGSFVYAWSLTAVLLYFIPFRIYLAGIIKNKNFKLKISNYLLIPYILIGILIGWSNEIMVSSICFGIILACLYLAKINGFIYTIKHLPLWFWILSIAITIGFLMMILGPGVSIRATVLNYHFDFLKIFDIQKIQQENIFYFIFYPLLGLIFFYKKSFNFSLESYLYTLVLTFSLIATSFSSGFGVRYNFAPIIFCIIIFINIIPELTFGTIKKNKLLIVIYTYLLTIGLVGLVNCFIAMLNINNYFYDLEKRALISGDNDKILIINDNDVNALKKYKNFRQAQLITNNSHYEHKNLWAWLGFMKYTKNTTLITPINCIKFETN